MGRRCGLLKIKPNEIQDWHTDKVGRNTVLIYPLTDNYAPCQTIDGEVDTPMFLNTQSKHAVYNNDNIRLNFQVPFDEDMDQCIQMFNDVENYELITP